MYEQLQKEAEQQRIYIYEKSMKIKGLQAENVIWINKNIQTTAEKSCILAEELGHHHTSTGNIIDQSNLQNRKQEKRARNWAYEKLVPLSSIVQACRSGIRSRHELAEYLDVTEEFLEEALKRYQEKYGLHTHVDHYIVCFEPLGVLEMFE